MDSRLSNNLISQALNLTDCSDTLIAIFDSKDRLRYANGAFRAAYFIAEDTYPMWIEFMRENYHQRRGTIIRNHAFDAWVIAVQSWRGTRGYRAFEEELYGGRWFWMTETIHADGWMLCTASDISSLRADERSIREARDNAIKSSQTDELTGVPNRRYVMDRINDLYVAEKSSQNKIGDALAVLDIDHFKRVNDRFGHNAGDEVLRDFARRLVFDIRLTDCFGRIGGEEFALIMPNTTVERAAEIVGRILSKIRESVPLEHAPDFRYTFSCGIAGTNECESPAELYKRADEALYAAKMAGRNRVMGSGGSNRIHCVA